MDSFETQVAYTREAWSDTAGVETLRRMAIVDRYSRWVFQKFASHVGRSVLEVGCGIGNMTPFFLRDGGQMTCIDILPESVEATRQQYANRGQFQAVVADISDSSILSKLKPEDYDTIVCINVLEHIENHEAALHHMHHLMMPGGKLLLFVPAGEYLYGQLDRALGHYRRYSLEGVRDLVRRQGFEIVDSSYMNVAGIPGWFLSSRILRRSVPPRGLLWLFNALTPFFIWFEEHVRLPIGQSVVCIARRPQGER